MAKNGRPRLYDSSERIGKSQNPYAAMTFREIGEELGISRSRAEQIFNSGIAKLRKMPAARDLFELADAMNEARERG